MTIEINWYADSRLSQELLAWWNGLEDDRGARATLRRCHDLNAVVLTPAYGRFYRHLVALNCWPEEAQSWQKDRLAAIVGLLAHIKANSKYALPVSMSDTQSDKPPVSEIRFRDLLKANSIDDLFVGLRRILPLISHTTNVQALVSDVFCWGDKVKKDWAYAYRWPKKQAA